MNFKKEIFISSDGSSTLYMPEINEYYHSHHGAIQEAKHVFIKNGLENKRDLPEITILEVGFGTGLNAFLTAIESLRSKQKIMYHSLEAFPLSSEQIEELNYQNLPELSMNKDLFSSIHQVEWEKEEEIHTCFFLKKIKLDLQQFSPEERFDLIYFDAFGPRVQPEMWTSEIFANLYKLLHKDGIFVTYCAKGQVKRDLKSVGFTVETLPGPPGKREMIRAIKC